MSVWPTLGATGPGRVIGQLCSIQAGVGFFSLGKLFALLLIPVAIGLYVLSLLPGVMKRYTPDQSPGHRADRGSVAVDERWVDFDRFDSIEVEVLPGQQWYPAGDLVFRNGAVETFRLAGVSRPETFRHTCLAARQGYLGRRPAAKPVAAIRACQQLPRPGRQRA